MFENTTFWLIVFYGFSALNLVFLLWFMRLFNRSKFRNDEGDTTYEIGYEEDPQGRPVKAEPGGSLSDEVIPSNVVSDFYQTGP